MIAGSINPTDLFKYLIRRTDIALLISNIRLGLRVGRINPIHRGSIEYLLDYTLGLVECRWDVEALPPDPTRILQWLILFYGGNRTWNKFAHIVQRDIRTATHMVECRQPHRLYLDDIERIISNLQIYSDILIGSILYDRTGGPLLNGEEYEATGTRMHRNIPTTDQERLAFRVEGATRELIKMRDDLVDRDYFTRLEDWEDERQLQPEEGAMADNDGPAIDSARHVGHQGDVGLPMTYEISNDYITGRTPVPSTEIPKESFSRHPDSSNTSKSIGEDMKELVEALQNALTLQENLIRQLRSGKDELENNIQPESSTQQAKRQDNSNFTTGKATEGKLETRAAVEHQATVESVDEETENNDKSKPILSIDTKDSMFASGGVSPSSSYVLFTPTSETSEGAAPSGWCSNISDRAVRSHSPEPQV